MATVSTVNAIPKMTSNTAPSGIVSASSFNASGQDPWKAFDSIANTNWRSKNGDPLPQWLSYEFTSPIIISAYKVTVGSTFSYTPKSWTFEGSNDGSNWTVLDTRSNVTNWTLSSFQLFDFFNMTAYKAYRINITENNGGTFTDLLELEMYEIIFDSKFLISSGNGKLYSLKNAEYTSNLIPVMTSDTTPAGSVSGSSKFSGYEFFRCFDGSNDNSWQSSDYSLPQWVAYEFSGKQKINRYSLVPRFIDRMPSDWTFEGWDGSSWVVLDTRTGIVNWTQGVPQYFEFINYDFYIKYRIHITKAQRLGIYTNIGEMTMESLIPADLLEIPNTDEQSFINHGLIKDFEVDLNGRIDNRVLIENVTTTLGTGKVFKRTIDTSKIPVKNISIK
ncbi:discoidin domain-containing protein [Paenibacillus sp. CR_12]|uniref:discoidin domain-containing protein n=1 Tax=Paenibacillus sp. CR_12 TaxID=3055793 RepID=UPI0035C209CE